MGICMSKECIEDYMHRLSEGLAEYMKMPISSRSTEAVDSMMECYARTKAMLDMIEDKEELTYEDALKWCKRMSNSDGSEGGHWSVAETSTFAKPSGCTDYGWNAAMNMMYSDYYTVADKYGVNTAEFYADMARAFIDDEDAGTNKLAKYYHYISK